MSGRDLYRNVLRGGQFDTSTSSPSQVLSSEMMSPMSTLAYSLHSATLSQTPRKRLSLHSNLSDTPQSCHNTSSQQSFSSLLQNSQSSDSGSCLGDESATSPHHLSTSPVSPHSLSSPCTLAAVPRTLAAVPRTLSASPCTLSASPRTLSASPRHLSTSPRHQSSRNKENFPSPYYSPSRSASLPPRPRISPLKEVQNTVNRSLNFSPRKKNLQMVSPEKRIFTSPRKPSPPDDFDTNSQDSGYSESGKKVEDCFSVPISCAPRKLNLDLSPPKSRVSMTLSRTSTNVSSSSLNTIFSAAKTSTPLSSSSSSEGSRPFRKFSSLASGEEDDAMLRDLMDEEMSQEGQPMGLSTLLSAPIQPPSLPATSPILSYSVTYGRPSIRRCLSMVDTTPTSSRVVCMTSPVSSTSAFKRPDPPTDVSVDCKRRRLEDPTEQQLSPLTSNAATTTGIEKIRSPLAQRQVSAPESSNISSQLKPKLMRCHSESHVSIMKALNRSTGHGDLIGDFSKPWLLPTLDCGKHADLKSISVDTLAEVVKGKFNSKLASCRIIDCRYPYEFEGGHIRGAEMWHHPEMVGEHLKAQKGSPVIMNDESLRHILIFHCEFSAERGPKAQRLLREMDRTANKEHYPALHFPEIYLLEGGYKSFYEKHPYLCTPNDYVRMLDANHTEDLKHFRGKSKSWAAENKQSKSRNALPRTGLKRLGL